jgi:hypothetical protein
MSSGQRSKTTSRRSDYGLMDEVHFTINHNRHGWFITEIGPTGMPTMTHGPFADPLNRLDAMSILISITKLE